MENVEKMCAEFKNNTFSFTLMKEIVETELDSSFCIDNKKFYKYLQIFFIF